MPTKGSKTAQVMDTMAYHLSPDASIVSATWTAGTKIDSTLLAGDVNEATLIKWLQIEYVASITDAAGTYMIPALLAIYKATSVRDIADEDIMQDLKLNKSLYLHQLVTIPHSHAGVFKLRKMLRRVILSPGPENLYMTILPKKTSAANVVDSYKVLKYSSQLTG